LEDFRSNPRADDCLAVMKIWEDARLGNHLTPADCQTLRNVKPEDACYVTCYEQREVTQIIHSPEKQSAAQRRILADRREHHLFLNEKERYELVEIEEVAGVAGGRVKAFVFTRADRPGDTMAIIWAIEGELRLAIPRRGLTAMRPFGQAHAVEPTADGTRLVVGSRTYLVFGATAPAEATRLLRAARAT
jgi:hypothetical protein